MRGRFLRHSSVTLVLTGLVAGAQRAEAQSDKRVHEMAELLAPEVERAVGLPFKLPPRVAVRSRSAVREYMTRKLYDDLPPHELEGLAAAYRLFGLIPDTLDLRELLLALYTEQVVGYYDPDSSTLYVVAGSDPGQLRILLAHELVHALQGQYMPLDSVLDPGAANDRRMAAQAVLEGQATLAALTAFKLDRDFEAIPDFWNTYRRALKQQHEQMPVFNTAPTIIRETLIFPYLGGADFVRWFDRYHGDTVPFGPRLPQSTEQVLHPDRYSRGDMPISLVLTEPDDAVYSDGLGEFETRVLLTVLTGSESMGRAGALAWGGDRYGVYRVGDDQNALVWWTLWDTERAADRFATLLSREWPKRGMPSRRFSVKRTSVDGRPGVQLIDAPKHWPRWNDLPKVAIRN